MGERRRGRRRARVLRRGTLLVGGPAVFRQAAVARLEDLLQHSAQGDGLVAERVPPLAEKPGKNVLPPNGHKRSGTGCWGVAEQALSVPSGAFGSFPLRECLRHESPSRSRGIWTRRPRPFGAPPPALIRPSVLSDRDREGSVCQGGSRGSSRFAEAAAAPASARPPQHPFGLEADAARPPSGSCPAAGRLLGRLLPGSGRQPPGRWAAAAAAAGQHPLDRTTPKQSLKTPAYAAILIFCDDLYSPEKRLTVPIRTCRGRAPETSPDHRTRQIAPLLCGCFLV